MSRVQGRMLCDDVFLRKPAERVRLAAERLKLLWQVDISGCPVRQTAQWRISQSGTASGLAG